MDPASQPLTTEAHAIELEAPASTSLLDQLLAHPQGVLSLETSRSTEAQQEKQSALPWSELVGKWCERLKQQKVSLNKVRLKLSKDIARIDTLLESQVNAILHHPRFQALESQWRGLRILCDRAAELAAEVESDVTNVTAKIRLLSVTKRELFKDFDRAVEFDQNSLFKKVYEEEFGMSGGEPYGMLLANFDFTSHPDDVDLLEKLAGVGAASFCPVITSASASMLGLESLSQLDQPFEIDKVLKQAKYRKWLSLRKHTDTQFLGVTLPRVLMRLPYEDHGAGRHGFRFRESVEASTRKNYLWGPSSWAFACVALRAFMHSGWFADIRGMERGVDGGGLVSEFPVDSFGSDNSDAARKTSVEVAVSDRLENELSNAGFIPLSDCKDTPFSVFYSNPSLHEPAEYKDQAATMNARVSAMLQYVLCCSRVAHFLRIEARDKIGSTNSAREIEDYLKSWITRYVTPDSNAPPAQKARYPLQKADVLVEEIPGKPGEYRVVIHLLPHYQLDSLSSTMTLTARNVSGPGSN